MSAAIYELLFAYARLGVRDWKSKSRSVRRKARSIRARIADHEGLAARALAKPFKPSAINGDPLMLIPMPGKQKKVFAAFFAPWIGSRDQEHLSFDLVVLLQHGASIAFRFEPGARRSGGFHGYDHVQLNERLGLKQVALDGAMSPLPTTYPAFPIPGRDPVTRFLAMMVSMHGFPRGVDNVFASVFQGQPKKRKTYLDMTVAMLR